MKARFIQKLENAIPRKLAVFGTSLSFHLAPHLRDALTARFGDLIAVHNAGLSARASRSALDELETKVLNFAPDALMLEFAVNDAYNYENFPDDTRDKGISLAESRANLETLVARVQRALPACEILILTMNPAHDAPHNDNRSGSRRSELTAFYQSYRNVAREKGLALIDCHRFWSDLRAQDEARFQTLIPDGVHPTPTAIKEVLVPFLAREIGFDTSFDATVQKTP